MMSNGRMVKSLKLKLRIFGALAGMTSLLITLLPTYVQAETDPVHWEDDTDSGNYLMEDFQLSGGVTGTLVKEYKGTKTNLRIPAQLSNKTVVLLPEFKLSDAVENLNISQVKPQDATKISKLFAGCTKVKKIIFQEKVESNTNTFDTSAVTDMSGLFEGCEALSELDLSSLDTHAVTDMSGMFKGCKSLQTLTFGDNFNTTQVTDIHEMFQGCGSLQSLDLRAFDLGALDQSKVADFLNGVTASTILSPKKNLLEDKIALPGSENEYYSDEYTQKNVRFLPKTDNADHTLKKKTGINTVTALTDRQEYEMYLGDTLSLNVEKGPGNATDVLTWEVLGSDNTPLPTSNDCMEITTTPDTNCKLTAKKDGTYQVQVKPSTDYSWLSQNDQAKLKKTWKVTVKPGYRAEVQDNRSELSQDARNTAKGFSEEGKYNIQISDNAANLEQAVKSGQNYKNAYMARYFTLKLEKTAAPAFDRNNYKPIKVTLPIPQSMKSLIAKGAKPELLALRGASIYPVNYQLEPDNSSVTFEVSKEDLQQNLEVQYALIYKTNPDGSANGSSGSSNSASGTSGAIIVNVSPTPITVNVQAGSSSSANSSNSSSNGSSNGSVIIYQNPNGINGGNVIRTLGGGGINGMDMPKTADSMSIRYRTLGAMIMALLGALLFLSSFLVGGFAGRQPELAVSRESRQKRRFEADEDSRWLE